MQLSNVSLLAQQSHVIQPDLVVIYAGHNLYNSLVYSGDIAADSLWVVPVFRWLHASAFYRAIANPTRLLFAPPQGGSKVIVTQSNIANQLRDSLNNNLANIYREILSERKVPIMVSGLLHNS